MDKRIVLQYLLELSGWIVYSSKSSLAQSLPNDSQKKTLSDGSNTEPFPCKFGYTWKLQMVPLLVRQQQPAGLSSFPPLK
jgi:hypothetical protein